MLTSSELPIPPPGVLARPTLGNYVHWFRATWRITLFALIGITIFTLLIILFLPRTYRSQSKLLLSLGRESVTLDPTAAATGQMMPLHQTREHEIETALNVMSSRQLLEAVVQQIGADTILAGNIEQFEKENQSTNSFFKGMIPSIDPVPRQQQAIRRLSEDLVITAGRDSSVVSIEYRTGSPELAQCVVSCWVKHYISRHSEFHRSQGTYDFFRIESEKLREQLTKVRNRLRDEKISSGMLTIEGQQQMVEAEMAAVRMQKNKIEGQLAASQTRAKKLAVELEAIKRSVVLQETAIQSDSRETMRALLFELEVQEKNLESLYTDGHPRLVTTRRQLEDARRLLADESNQHDEVIQGINPTYQSIETELALENATTESLSHQLEVLKGQLLRISDEFRKLNSKFEIVADLNLDANIIQAQYHSQSERLEQARLEEVLQQKQITNVREIQPATLENRPVSPNKLLCLAVGIIAFFSAAIGIPVCLGPQRVDPMGPGQSVLTDPAHTNQRATLANGTSTVEPAS
jgi:polysaccharide biosynthesis protein PslE